MYLIRLGCSCQPCNRARDHRESCSESPCPHVSIEPLVPDDTPVGRFEILKVASDISDSSSTVSSGPISRLWTALTGA